ncbi:MAG: photosynthetic complex putative assembly protein PuhB [Nevskia sp.]
MTHEAATTVRELPEPLPPGEFILWQGGPHWRSLYVGAFHARSLALYFGALLTLRGLFTLADHGALIQALVSMLWLLPLAAAGLGVVALLAWLTARASWYTITNRRVVMRIGIALEITFNFPFRVIESAGLRLFRDGTGDLPLMLTQGSSIAYLHLWPHARPWRFKQTQPMLRSIPRAELVADVLSKALAEAIADGSAHKVVPLPTRRRDTLTPAAAGSQPLRIGGGAP